MTVLNGKYCKMIKIIIYCSEMYLYKMLFALFGNPSANDYMRVMYYVYKFAKHHVPPSCFKQK